MPGVIELKRQTRRQTSGVYLAISGPENLFSETMEPEERCLRLISGLHMFVHCFQNNTHTQNHSFVFLVIDKLIQGLELRLRARKEDGRQLRYTDTKQSKGWMDG